VFVKTFVFCDHLHFKGATLELLCQQVLVIRRIAQFTPTTNKLHTIPLEELEIHLIVVLFAHT